MSSEAFLPFHPSFQAERKLDQGVLYFSDQFPDIAIRSHHVSKEYSPLEIAQNILAEVAELERIGIDTVRAAPVVAASGLVLVCDRLHGNNMEDEILGGNTEATLQFGNTLAKLSKYYENAASQPEHKSFMGDIATPSQYTWQDGKVVLHDLSKPITNELGKNYFNETLLLNVGFIATEFARHHTGFDPDAIEDICRSLEAIIDVLEKRLPVDKRYIMLTRLIIACKDNPQALQHILEMYDAELFDH